ncbi:hypothetical protein Q8A67_007142 [Cirrhinus molitorella]|uniref:Uncharacterized protein n=1 Tax=Cirrhinus molitorella TaxID=172907 RepID=A0AA88PYM6_9TELE|nr:hypothetical protein Q8A67_007142 [Cirrhinus molitorella]
MPLSTCIVCASGSSESTKRNGLKGQPCREPLAQRSQTQFLEGRSSAEFSSNQLQLTPAWKFLVNLKSLISWIRCPMLLCSPMQCEIYPSCLTAICLGPYCGLAFALCCLCSVYSGHQSFLVPSLELDTNHLLK